jgi:hypothetical protein
MSDRAEAHQLPGCERRQIPVLIALSAFWESLFIGMGSNLLDEGWALYTGMHSMT